ncbi:cystein proteinase inhibitor protein salarin isoform X1 [Oncorhynchus clarkii lewisi]|uniref:cystein proteinase inhibitor protein salarin isoform X1 n=1 Tax=Oncorhynchus clarkii lewisi TaxID=490388 RepID=UPI0039B92E35
MCFYLFPLISRMKSLVLLLLVGVTVSSVLSKPLPEDSEAEVHKEFETWKVKYGKSYPSTEEEAKRKEMWLATRKRVMEHNMRAGNGLESFTMAVNHFADLTNEEVPRGLLPMPRPEEEEVDREFEMWKTHNGKTYNSTEEEAKRKEIWLATRARVMEHNKRAENGSESFTMGMNSFSDMTSEEIPRGGLLVVSPSRDGGEEAEVDKEFETWKVQHGKSYGSTEEEAKRKEIWLATRARVMEHNKRAENGSESFTMGMNHLSDQTTAEVTGRRLQDGEETEVHKEFQTWKVKYGKTYPSPEEEAKRKEIWLATRKMVTEHNKRAENGLESYTLAVNHFADLTTQEVPRGLLPMLEGFLLPHLLKIMHRALGCIPPHLHLLTHPLQNQSSPAEKI